jgi:uroporphyrinogen decarboxylase
MEERENFMTPRERILAALGHREPDRVPVDLGSTESSSIMAMAYNRLKQRLGLGGRTQIFDIGQMIVKVELPVVERLGVDVIALLIEPRRWKPWTLPDGSAAEIPERVNIRQAADGGLSLLGDDGAEVAHCPQGGLYFDTVVHPLEKATTVEDIDAGTEHFRSFDWASYWDEDYADLREKARRLRQETPYAIVADLWIHLFAAGQVLRGFENFMVDLLADKPLAHRLLQRQVEAYWPRIDKYVEAVGPYVDIIQVNDDLGTQAGPQLSPELYREMVKPYHKKLWGYIKEKSGKPLLLHSCGSIYRLLPDLIEIGVEALNPIQVSAADMDTRRLKREFGRDLVFWGGGCDTQTVLARGTPQEVRDEVRRRVDDLSPGGGFVFCQVHNIQADVPVDNILAMYEELGTLS